jgi:hypothetical protein
VNEGLLVGLQRVLDAQQVRGGTQRELFEVP